MLAVACTTVLTATSAYLSYGSNIPDAYRQVGVYVVKGAKPEDSFVQSTNLELVINHQTARILGLTVPDKLLATR